MTAIARGQGRLADLLAEARARARRTRRRVLVSVAEPVETVDPLHALATVAPLASEAALERTFWARPGERFAIAGVGTAADLTAQGPGAFAAIDREWAQLREDALIDDGATGMPAVGPTLLGGFAFDPESTRTTRWSGFPDASLLLPALQLTAIGDRCWLTTNVIVDAEGEPDVALELVATVRERFVEAPGSLSASGRGARLRGDANAAIDFTDVRPPRRWQAAVEAAVAAIRAGAMEKVVLAREVQARATAAFDEIATIARLRDAFPECHVFGFWRGGATFVGASPERLVRLDGRAVQVSCLAGSIGRGATPAEDRARQAQLLASAKDREEHAVVKDALCHTLAELADDVTASDEPALLALPNVHHLHTAIGARLRAGRSILDLVARLHPTPAVGGHPREAALRFIRDHEELDRGWYGGPVGWIGRGSGEFAVALRSALVAGREAWAYAGCGIVADSNADEELAESVHKLRAVQSSLTVTP